jgi:hypothetical protein
MELPSFVFAAGRDPLDRHALASVACGISTRKYARSLEPLPEDMEERSSSKSAVSRRYVAMTTKQMTTWLTKPLGDRHFPIVMIDGIVLGDHTVLIALGIDTEGKKQVLGLREGDTENSRVAKALLRHLIDRGLSQDRARLFVIGGAKALSSAIRKVFGKRCVIPRFRGVPQLAIFLLEGEGHVREAGDAEGSGPVLVGAAGIVGEVGAIREGVCAEAQAVDPRVLPGAQAAPGDRGAGCCAAPVFEGEVAAERRIRKG